MFLNKEKPMAKAKKLNIEFAFGMPSGVVVFVMSGCLRGALTTLRRAPKAWAQDRKNVMEGVTERPAEGDAIVIAEQHLLWWTVFEDGRSLVFEGNQYPGNAWVPSLHWLVTTRRWKWGLIPERSGGAVPRTILRALGGRRK